MKKRRVGIMLELMWPFRRHLDVFAGTQRFAKDAGAWVCEIDEFVHERGNAARSQLAGYDGLIARATPQLARLARRAKVPLVNVWYNSPEFERLPGVFPDFAEVGRQAIEHLADRGFREFGCLSIPRERAHQVMINAFHEVVSGLGRQCHCLRAPRRYYRDGQAWTRFQRALDEWISTWRPPIALFVAFTDATTRYVVHACRRHGLRVPEDVALVTSSNEPMIAEMPPPSLTSVEVDYEQIGYQAARLLDRMMRGGEPAVRHPFVRPTGIIARDSTDFFAVDDEVVAAAMRFIEQHMREDIAVDDVAAAAGVSRRTLERRFQGSAGRSIAAEIRRLRVLKAKRLLAESDLLVKQIAREAGFRDPIRLNEVFLREEQMTPSEFRRRIRGES
ncbi:MAG: substrate-binding domain-containing protein [Pirellulaceae bacterium]